MRDPVDVVRVQSEGSKTPEIMLKTADCLKKYGFEKESKFITGEQTWTLMDLPVLIRPMWYV